MLSPSEATEAAPSQNARARAVLVDAHTHTFWARGEDAPTTLVETSGTHAPSSGGRRADALVRAHENGDDVDRPAGRPRGNPVFSEALFVELMRAHQYRRAFEQLTADCQRRWGTAEAFAAAQGASAMRRLRGVTVKDVRFLAEWTDPEAGTSYQEVAELKVEYAIGERDRAAVVPRTVHLVPDRGRWRSICYPE